nr:plastocyanin [archaeon]
NSTVTWINQDDTAHGIASDKGGHGSWGSPGILRPGDSFSVTFNNTGTYDYHGAPHPWQTGKVIVLGR